MQAYFELESFEMAKIDVIEERLNNHIRFFWWVIGSVLAVLGFVAVELYRINGHLGELDGLRQDITKVALQTQASLPQSTFEKVLPDIRSTIAIARQNSVNVPPAVVEEIRSKLLASNSDAPDFWPTLSEFVSYRSSLSFHLTAAPTPLKNRFRNSLVARLPDCTDSQPKPMTIKEVLNPNKATQNPGLYENCRFVLDSAKQDQALNAILRGSTPSIIFKNCLIEYHGGEINLILAWDKVPFTFTIVGKGPGDPSRVVHTELSGPAIQFENCLFIFDFQNSPPPNGQRLSTTLLAENNPTSFSLPISQ